MKRRALLAGLVSAPAFAGGKIGSGKWITGGVGGITRSRVGVIGTQTQYGVSSLMLPRDHYLYTLPMDCNALSAGLFFNEAADLTVCDNALHCVRTAGLWQASLSIDWPGQNIVSGLRKATIWMCPAGTQPPPYVPGQLTRLIDASPYIRLASQDSPGSADTPNADAWTTLNAALAYLDVGDSVFATVCSETPGDWIQASAMTFLQMTLIARGTSGSQA
jgi:hypothetical protein